jgi:hypothetical protein
MGLDEESTSSRPFTDTRDADSATSDMAAQVTPNSTSGLARRRRRSQRQSRCDRASASARCERTSTRPRSRRASCMALGRVNLLGQRSLAKDASVLVWARSFAGRSYRRYGDVAGTIWMGRRPGRLPISASDFLARAIKHVAGDPRRVFVSRREVGLWLERVRALRIR